MSDIFYQPKARIFSQDGSEVGAGYKFYFYQTGTTTPITTYSNPGLTLANTNPVVADQYGYFNLIYVSDFSQVKVVVKDADDNTIYTVDPVNPAGSSSITLNDLGVRPTSYWGLTAGTASAYTLAANPTLPAYSNMNSFLVQFHVACNASPTLDVDGLGALNLKKYTGQGTKVALQAGDVQAAERYLCINDGVDIVVLNPRTQMLYLGTTPTLTISAGTATITNACSHYLIDGEGAAADTLDTINGGADGQEIILQIVSSARAITFSLSGNILTTSGESLIVNDTTTQIRAIYRSSDAKWIIETNSRPRVYAPSNQTITSSGTLTLAHGFGKAPDLIRFTLVCTGNEFGYVVGDEISVTPNNSCSSGADNFGFVAQIDATNITILFGANVAVFYNILNKTTRTAAAGTLTNANWALKIKAFLFT